MRHPPPKLENVKIQKVVLAIIRFCIFDFSLHPTAHPKVSHCSRKWERLRSSFFRPTYKVVFEIVGMFTPVYFLPWSIHFYSQCSTYLPVM